MSRHPPTSRPVTRRNDTCSVFVILQICSFDHDVPAGTVLEALSALKILSAPVMVRPDHVEGPGRVHYSSREVPLKGLMGFVGVSDILEGFLKGEEAARVLY
jgi:hypothetical protein